MNRTFRSFGTTLAALALAGCSKHPAINAPAVSGGSASFAVVASVGTSLTAGFESGGLVVHHQTHGFAYDFAKQVGAAFTIPSVSADGLPPLLAITGWTPQGQPIIAPQPTPGTPTNALQLAPYNDMGVPDALLFDLTNDTRYTDNNTLFPVVTRAPFLRLGSILDQVALLNPTFLTFEFGANELLGRASQGSGTPVMDVPTFTALLHATLDSVAVLMPNARVAIFNVPDPTSIPFFTTISPYLDPAGNCRVIGPGNVPLNLGDLVLLTAGEQLAAGHGVPALCGGLGDALPDTVVLLAANVTSIQAAVAGYNSAIQAEAAARGYALVDFHGLLQHAAASGLTLQGHTYTTEFVIGGLFSLDGVHPTDLGYAFMCNTLIDAVNARFGARIPPLNLAAYATATSSRLIPAYGHDRFPIIRNAGEVYGSMFNWRELHAPVP